jgi:drug/metabolite transporter (DMT)-like permease
VRKSRRFSLVDAALVVAVLVWAVNFSVVKAAISHIPPLAFDSIRLLGASTAFLLLARLSPGPSLLPGDGRRLLVLGLVGHTAYQLLFIFGIEATTAANSAILLGLTPVFVALLSTAAGERPRALAWVGIAISVLGVYLVLHDSTEVGGSLFGDALTLAATFCWSLHTVLSKSVVGRYGPIRTNAYAMSVGTLFFLPFGLPALLRLAPASIPASAWWGTAYSLLFSLVGAYVVWYVGVARIGPTHTAVYSNLTPVAALVVAYLALGEPVGGLQLIGVLAILGGIYLVRRRGPSRRVEADFVAESGARLDPDRSEPVA